MPADPEDLADALEMHRWCPEHEVPKAGSGPRQETAIPRVSSCASFAVGDGKAYATVQSALEASRQRQEQGCKEIILSAGMHFLTQTLELGPEDAGLRLVAEAPGSTWLSGGRAVEIDLADDAVQAGPTPGTKLVTAHLEDVEEMTGLFGLEPHVRYQRARWPNGDTERDQWGYASRLSGHVSIRAKHVKAWIKPRPGESPQSINVNLAKPGNPSGFVKKDSTMIEYNRYSSGRGGMCSEMWDLREQSSYWCGNGSAGGWAEVDRRCAARGQLELPVGLTLYANSSEARRMRTWKDAAAGPAVVHAWHSQSWFTNMWSVGRHEREADELWFDKGGSQGGRSWCACNECAYAGAWCGKKGDSRLISGTWYVENVAEELDSPGEYYFDRASKTLRLLVNASNLEAARDDTGRLTLVIPVLQTLIAIRNVSAIALEGVGFRDARATYLERYGVPSGGDWALYKGAAVMVEDASAVRIARCRFVRLDGNAILLYGRVRDAILEENEFAWLGESAMAAWGRTQEWDGRDGRQPRGTVVRRNVVREIGIYEKQSSAWFQAKACGTRIEDNLFFNMPRAAINFNDGFGGANVVTGNLLFNTCRESGDHGAINTWDRMPFLWDASGAHGFDALPTRIAQNLIFANYGASQAVDNDDGSSYYHIEDNAMFNSEGFKMDYGGHDSKFRENLVVVYPYDGQNCFNVADFRPGHAHAYTDNDCILTRAFASQDKVGAVMGGCQASRARFVLAKNRYYTPTGNATIVCGSDHLSLSTLQAQFPGLEVGSAVSQVPSPAAILQMLDRKVQAWSKNLEIDASLTPNRRSFI